MFPYAYKLISKFQSEEGIGIILLWDFRSSYSSRLHEVSSFNYNCTPTISERYHRVCYQRYENVLSNRKVVQLGPNVNVCASEKNLEEELLLNQYSIVVSIQISTLICFCL